MTDDKKIEITSAVLAAVAEWATENMGIGKPRYSEVAHELQIQAKRLRELETVDVYALEVAKYIAPVWHDDGGWLNCGKQERGLLLKAAKLVITKIKADIGDDVKRSTAELSHAEAWAEGFEAGACFRENQSTPSGIPNDPPSNPYEVNGLPVLDRAQSHTAWTDYDEYVRELAKTVEKVITSHPYSDPENEYELATRSLLMRLAEDKRLVRHGYRLLDPVDANTFDTLREQWQSEAPEEQEGCNADGYTTTNYTCTTCNRGFRTREDWDAHVEWPDFTSIPPLTNFRPVSMPEVRLRKTGGSPSIWLVTKDPKQQMTGRSLSINTLAPFTYANEGS